jgi:hypothetical protein
VVTVSDVIEHKALEMRVDVLAMSDVRRGFLISSADEAQRVRKEQAYEHFEVVVAEIRTLARQGEIRSCRGFGTFLMTRAFSARSYRSREHPFRVVGQ